LRKARECPYSLHAVDDAPGKRKREPGTDHGGDVALAPLCALAQAERPEPASAGIGKRGLALAGRKRILPRLPVLADGSSLLAIRFERFIDEIGWNALLHQSGPDRPLRAAPPAQAGNPGAGIGAVIDITALDRLGDDLFYKCTCGLDNLLVLCLATQHQTLVHLAHQHLAQMPRRRGVALQIVEGRALEPGFGHRARHPPGLWLVVIVRHCRKNARCCSRMRAPVT